MEDTTLNLTGAPDAAIYTDPSVVQRYAPLVEPIKAALAGNSTMPLPEGKTEMDAAALAQLTCDLQMFQHRHLGSASAVAATAAVLTSTHEVNDGEGQQQQQQQQLPVPVPEAKRTPPRIPAFCFLFANSLSQINEPLSVEAPVFCLLQAVLVHMAVRGRASWAGLASSAPEDVSFFTELVASVRDKLKEEGVIKPVKIAAAVDVTLAERQRCQEMASKLDCQWVEDAAEATHVLFSSDSAPLSPTTSKEEFFRTLAKTTISRSRQVSLVHVWYRPDSHDSWLPSRDFAEPDPEAKNVSVRSISTQWLHDSMRFNELVNEEDYEKDEEPTPGAATANDESMVVDKAANPRKRALPDEVSTEEETSVSSGPGFGKRIKLLVAARPTGAAAADLTGATGSLPGRNYEREPLPGGQLANMPTEGDVPPSASAEDQTTAKVAGQETTPSVVQEEVSDDAAREAQRLQTESIARKYLAEQTQEVIIPSYATWFSFSSINAVEKRSLPEFFNNRNRSKTPAIYKEYRNFMINTYRLNPSEYLTFTACRRNLAGDVCAIMRVHAFLEQWGLINYQIDPETRPATLGPPFTGHFRVTVDTPRGLQPLHPGTQRPSQPGMPGHANGGSASTPGKPDLTLELRRTVYQTSLKMSRPVDGDTASALVASADSDRNQAGSGSAYSCDTCGSDCTRSRYQSIRTPSRGTQAFSLCPTCYLEGRFPSSMYSGDFVRMEDEPFKQASDDSDWSDTETLRLLEGLEMYDDDWTQVANHVGTRSREQCITKFLQLPIEDDYLNSSAKKSSQANGSSGRHSTTQGDLGPLQYLRDGNTSAIPFAQADNPVMSVVAFLASAVSPAVAAAAAQSALGELTDGMRKRIASKSNGANNEDETSAAKEGPTPTDKGEAMEMDAVASADKDVAKDAEAAFAPTTKPSADSETIPKTAVERAASVALGAAAAKAHLLSTFEERECQRLVGQVIEAQMKKMELKMAHFEQLETLLEQERRSLEISRRQLYTDRLNVSRQISMVQDLVRKAQAAPASVQPREVSQASSVQQGVSQQGTVVREAPHNLPPGPTAAPQADQPHPTGEAAVPAPATASASAPASGPAAAVPVAATAASQGANFQQL